VDPSPAAGRRIVAHASRRGGTSTRGSRLRLRRAGTAAPSRARGRGRILPLSAELSDELRHEPIPGTAIINASWAGTGGFTATAVAATIAPDTFGGVNATVALVLFFAGCVVFLVAYGKAVSRSRTDAIGIGGLYFLAGSAPRNVQVRLLSSLAIQVVVALAS